MRVDRGVVTCFPVSPRQLLRSCTQVDRRQSGRFAETSGIERGGTSRYQVSFPFPFYLKVLQYKIATAASATPDDEGRGCCAYVQREGGRKTGCFSARMRLTEETPEPRDQVCPGRRCCCTLRGERDGGRALKPPPRFDCLVAPTR